MATVPSMMQPDPDQPGENRPRALTFSQPVLTLALGYNQQGEKAEVP